MHPTSPRRSEITPVDPTLPPLPDAGDKSGREEGWMEEVMGIEETERYDGSEGRKRADRGSDGESRLMLDTKAGGRGSEGRSG